MSRAFRKTGVKNQIWTVILLNEVVLADGGQQHSNIVQQSDWSSTGGERATVLTIRGWLSVSFTNDVSVASNEGSVFWYIGVIGDGIVTPLSPLAANTYIRPSILTTAGHLAEAVPIGGRANSKSWDINVKTMRTIKASETIALVLSNESDRTINTSGVIRALVRKGGN